MTPEELFSVALGLSSAWRVAQCRFEGEPKSLELRIEHVSGHHFQCPECGTSCGVHDTIERRWRHMNFFQYRCELVANVPRTWCRKDGVHQVQVPWARQGSGFTLMMEALVMFLSAQMPVSAIADFLAESDTRLWRILIHYVEQAQARADWSQVRQIAIDETSARRGHRYVTNVLDCDSGALLLMVEGRSSQALQAFAQALREHHGQPAQIQAIAMDMSPAYLKGAAQYFAQAKIVFDKFHVMMLAGAALDRVRRQLQGEGAQLKGALWSLRGNIWNLEPQRQKQRQSLCSQYTKLGRAMTLRDTLGAIYSSCDRRTADQQLQWWCGWASRSRLEPFRALAKTIREHKEGILAYFDSGLTSAAIEALNGIVQIAKRLARGFKNFLYFRTAAYLRASQLNFHLPAVS
jgi:transposase